MRRYVYIYWDTSSKVIMIYGFASKMGDAQFYGTVHVQQWWSCSKKEGVGLYKKKTSEFAVPGPCQWAAANTPSGLSQWNPVVGYIMGSGNSLKICRGQWPWRPSLQRKFRWIHYSRTIFFVHQIRGVPQIKMRVCRVRSAMRLLWIVESNDGDQLGYIINLANMPKL